MTTITAEHHTAQVNGTRLHYVAAGDGPPVMLLHGWPQTWYEWRHVIGLLATDHRVVAPDLRGFG
jgi:pimeloyl-ACP methyl ester carboxylesterase